jgi:hypothetical protein
VKASAQPGAEWSSLFAPDCYGVSEKGRVPALNVYAVAAVLAGVSGPAMLADKPAWTAVYVVAGVATEAFGVTRR